MADPTLFDFGAAPTPRWLVIVNQAAFLRSRLPLPLLGELPLSALDPVSVYPAIRGSSPSFLLESVARSRGQSAAHARYSFVGGEPYLIVTGREHHLQEIRPGDNVPILTEVGDPFERVRQRWERSHLPIAPGFPPFIGGMVGCVGYGFSRRHYREAHRFRRSDFPDLYCLFVDVVVVFDHLEQRLLLIFCPPAERFLAESRERLYSEGCERLGALATRIRTAACCRASPPLPQPAISIASCTSKDEYCAMVARAKAYIAAGDIFQANLAQRFTATLGDRDAFELYRRLRAINPAPFSAFLDLGDTQVVSSSPERLVRVKGTEVDTRPIAGTRPRGGSPDEDDRLTVDLLLNAKERAEHIMLVDLERNDLGRVCAYGTVKVDELMVTERYSHVMHIVSNVRGLLRTGATPFDAIEAVFPGGTVTGVPKVRCLEIIEELEPSPRGLYTGAIGYLSWSGDTDWSIVIRTLMVHGGRISLHAGAGIVAESDPEREYSETLYKAQALFEAMSGA